MNKIIIGENIVKSFGEGDEKRNVLDGVSVEIKEGEFVSVMGPSGSGKSTLIYALSGMDDVDSGKVVFDGSDLSSLKEVTLAGNQLHTLPDSVLEPLFRVKNLEILDLSQNLLTILPESIGALSSLRILRLGKNQFFLIPLLDIGYHLASDLLLTTACPENS